MSFDIVQMQLSFKFKSTTCKTKCCKISKKGHTDIIVVWPWVNRILDRLTDRLKMGDGLKMSDFGLGMS